MVLWGTLAWIKKHVKKSHIPNIAYYPFYENDFGYSFLLRLGDKCECLEPENVRAEITRRVKSLSAIYV
ncbi:hypothetical protein [Anaerosolibacter sp.]|uniref:hypothetical protein n=1 Tax=Anaerosolibacter sp. TaxID=1872527 RepID=UPI003FA43088